MTAASALVWLVDAVIALTVIEGLVLVLWHRRTRRGVPGRELVPVLAAGLSLMLALRAALAGAGGLWIVAGISAAGIAHAAHLRGRWRASSPQARDS